MRVVTARGNRRSVWELPCSTVFKAAPAETQKAAVGVLLDVMEKAGVKFCER